MTRQEWLQKLQHAASCMNSKLWTKLRVFFIYDNFFSIFKDEAKVRDCWHFVKKQKKGETEGEGVWVTGIQINFTMASTVPQKMPINMKLEIRMEWQRYHWHSSSFSPRKYKCNQCSLIDTFFLRKDENDQERENIFLFFPIKIQRTRKHFSVCPCDGVWVTQFAVCWIC